MRKFLVALFLICALFMACTALADGVSGVPAEINAILAQSTRWAPWTVTDYVCPDGGQIAFVALHKDAANELLCFSRKSGQWKLTWNLHDAVPQGSDALALTDRSHSAYAGLSLGTAFSFRLAVPGEWESVYELKSDVWRLRAIVYVDPDGKSITENYLIKTKQVVYSGSRKKGEFKMDGVVQTDLRYFSYSAFVKDPDRLKGRLSNPPSIPYGTLSAQEIQFTGGMRYNVYQGPGEGYSRAGDGKALVSTNDWIQVFGQEDGWIMIQYDITRGHMRIGWIEESSLPKGASVPTLAWQGKSAWLSKEASITDDPLNSQSAILTLPKGTWVTALGTLGDWVYVESSTSDLLRGFVKADALIYDRVFALEDFSNRQAAGTLTVTLDGVIGLDMTVSMANAPASFLLKDEYTGCEIGKAYPTLQGGYAYEGVLPIDVSSVSFIPVSTDGTRATELFRIEW